MAVSSEVIRVFRPPSRVFNATLPVNPSVTTTSAASVSRSRPSTLPMNRAPSNWASVSRPWAFLTNGLPFPGSSPMDSRAIRGSSTPRRSRANTAPIRPNCTNHSGLHSELAPASSSTVGVVPGAGRSVAIAGRATPRIRPIRRRALAIAAPVLPALTIAEATPSRTASAARIREESFIRRTLEPGSASMAITSEAAITSRSPMSPNSPGRPTRTTGRPRSSAARRAPATISSGARSPPMASTATGSTLRPCSVDANRDHHAAIQLSRRRRSAARRTIRNYHRRGGDASPCRSGRTDSGRDDAASMPRPDDYGPSLWRSSSSGWPSVAPRR